MIDHALQSEVLALLLSIARYQKHPEGGGGGALIARELGPLLLTWINLNHSMDKWPYTQLSVVENYLSFPKPQRCNQK